MCLFSIICLYLIILFVLTLSIYILILCLSIISLFISSLKLSGNFKSIFKIYENEGYLIFSDISFIILLYFFFEISNSVLNFFKWNKLRLSYKLFIKTFVLFFHSHLINVILLLSNNIFLIVSFFNYIFIIFVLLTVNFNCKLFVW